MPLLKHLLITKEDLTPKFSEFDAINFDCRNDAFRYLVDKGAVMRQGPENQPQTLYELSNATRSLI